MKTNTIQAARNAVRLTKWREDELKFALNLMFSFLPDERRDQFFAAWEHYERLRPVPPGAVPLDRRPAEPQLN